MAKSLGHCYLLSHKDFTDRLHVNFFFFILFLCGILFVYLSEYPWFQIRYDEGLLAGGTRSEIGIPQDEGRPRESPGWSGSAS